MPMLIHMRDTCSDLYDLSYPFCALFEFAVRRPLYACQLRKSIPRHPPRCTKDRVIAYEMCLCETIVLGTPGYRDHFGGALTSPLKRIAQ